LKIRVRSSNPNKYISLKTMIIGKEWVVVDDSNPIIKRLLKGGFIETYSASKKNQKHLEEKVKSNVSMKNKGFIYFAKDKKKMKYGEVLDSEKLPNSQEEIKMFIDRGVLVEVSEKTEEKPKKEEKTEEVVEEKTQEKKIKKNSKKKQ